MYLCHFFDFCMYFNKEINVIALMPIHVIKFYNGHTYWSLLIKYEMKL